VVVSGIENTRKPFDIIYTLILDRYQIDAETALFIDDNLNNVNAAKKNGIQAIHFSGEKKLHLLPKLSFYITKTYIS
jgi:2-haloacid dehalogenase